MRKSRITRPFVFLGILVALLVCCGGSKKERFLFLEKAKGLGGIVIKQASADMNLCKMYNTVWEYAKVTNRDFRSAYREMMLDTTEIKAEMASSHQMMDAMMDMAEKPPKNMTGIRDKLFELREKYLEFNRYVVPLPQVSQEVFNAKADAFITAIHALKSELDTLIAEAEANL